MSKPIGFAYSLVYAVHKIKSLGNNVYTWKMLWVHISAKALWFERHWFEVKEKKHLGICVQILINQEK